MLAVALLSLLLLATIAGCGSAEPQQQPSTATPTSEPTTPSPEATPACPTLDQATYFLALSKIQTGVAAAFADLGETFALAGEEPLLIFNDDWRLNVAITLTTMNIAAEQIRALNPPPGLEDLHALQLQIADQLEIVTSSSVQGIDDVDAALLDEATTAIARTNTLVASSADIIERVCD
ncbi:MAG: hypothetical protein HOH95_06830 [Dehalococcoidia bacterium]|jgi:hypothetical protein|nr:hypothetical protein [Dehalococcoidia bacterium]